jgi:uncharacterized protein (TIGR02757 family)
VLDHELKAYCDAAYGRYHRPEYVSPDPLELVLRYDLVADREIAGFVAAALALGRVGGIIRAARWVLDRLGSPRDALLNSTDDEIRVLSDPFVYRFFDGRRLAGLLIGMKHILIEFGSLEVCFATGLNGAVDDGAGDVEPAEAGLSHLVGALIAAAGGNLDQSILVARPDRGSACKRLFLFLRWMVRNDAVDPGGWTALTPSQLMIPVDTHMLSICRSLGLTTAKQATLSVSREITEAFRRIAPHDPVRYDFSLTRLGIHPEGRTSDLRREIRANISEHPRK